MVVSDDEGYGDGPRPEPHAARGSRRTTWAVTAETWAKAAEAVRSHNLELFNLEADLSEERNLAAKNPDIYAELRKQLAQRLEAIESTYR